jgi:photosystem II stability/assembly factor-like uncharacterized protein
MKNIVSKLGLFSLTLVLMGQGCFSLGGPNNNQPQTFGPGGMFVSTNKGDSWQSISLLPTVEGVTDLSNTSVYRLFTDPQDKSALYWATRSSGFYYSYDQGRTWQQPKGDLATGFVYSVAVDPRDRCTLFVTNGRSVHKSIDCSRSWEEVYQESRLDTIITSLVFNPRIPERLLMLIANGDLLQTTNQGNSWKLLHRFETESVELFADPLQQDVIYMASRGNGLYRSLDSGQSWTNLRENMSDFPGANEYRRFYALETESKIPTETSVLYWISTYGILRSGDGGDTWSAVELITPAGSVQIYGFAVNPENEDELYYTATINNRSTFYRTKNAGVEWTTKRLPSAQIPTLLYVHPISTEVVYLGFTIPPR